MNENITRKDKLVALSKVAQYRPGFTAFIVVFSVFATLLEAIGLTFLLPIIEAAQEGGIPSDNPAGIAGFFFALYSFLGVPFTLEYLILGLSGVMIIRYSSTFGAKWLAVILSKDYERNMKTRSFEAALEAQISYYDDKGSDEILNAIITQTRYAGRVINGIVKLLQQILLSLMYVSVALIVAPWLTISGAVLLGGISYFVQNILEPGYAVGDRVANANERIQQKTQAGTQGIREVKLFGVVDDIYSEFRKSVDTYTDSGISLNRNEAAITSFYQLLVALMLFGLLYVAISVLSLPIATLGVFLFAMFRLAPRVSNMNSRFYNINGNLPHLVRTQQFIEHLRERKEDRQKDHLVPDTITSIAFEDVSFSYTDDEQVLNSISFEAHRGEFVGFVGQSGAGKSTIVSLLARMYDPDSGEILANGIPVGEFDVRDWRKKIAMVRQDPFIFNDTLWYNITMGAVVQKSEVRDVAEIAKVTEFLPDLPDGFDTVLGDDGVKLSGGQRQRVALARALLADSDVLILDEATSDLDSNLEQQIHAAIEELDDDRIIIAIAHRLSTVQGADCIYTIEQGEITETGTHQELVDKGGKYAELYAIQT
ncbi:ABC transporter ATP-binding protein [Halobellus rubicundus]|uniref:ABC transporter ATP-binding protein n=1 Tax=Halobellus rubicundus TaxID=2996466 RepID=A0ABD5MA71_9EURY